jgi:hypothetical protein
MTFNPDNPKEHEEFKDQLWIKNNFVEGSQHEKLDYKIPFELNVYFTEEQHG